MHARDLIAHRSLIKGEITEERTKETSVGIATTVVTRSARFRNTPRFLPSCASDAIPEPKKSLVVLQQWTTMSWWLHPLTTRSRENDSHKQCFTCYCSSSYTNLRQETHVAAVDQTAKVPDHLGGFQTFIKLGRITQGLQEEIKALEWSGSTWDGLAMASSDSP